MLANMPVHDIAKGLKIILGGCPRIAIFSQIKAFLKNKSSHIVDIRALFFQNNAALWRKGILGQPPRTGLHQIYR